MNVAALAEAIAYILGVILSQQLATVIRNAVNSAFVSIFGANVPGVGDPTVIQMISYTYHSVIAQGELLANATYGLEAAHTERQAILSALAALPAGSDIVIPDSGANAEAVWLYQGGMRAKTGTMLAKLDEANTKLGPIAGYLYPGTSWFGYYNPTTFLD